MELQDKIEAKPVNHSPFNNLFLIKGYVTGKNQLWMYLFGIAATILGYTIFQFIVAKPLINFAAGNGVIITDKNLASIFNADYIGLNRSVMLAIMGGMFVFAILFLWLVIKFIHQKTFISIVTGFEKIRWKRYFFSFAVWSGLTILYVLVGYFSSPDNFEIRFHAPDFFALVLVSVLFLPIQTATEELFLRSYLLQGLSLAFKNGIIPLVITSVIFGLMHGTNPEAKAHGLWLMMPYYILFGAFLGMLTLLDEGAELAMGIHCANNLVSCLLICTKNSVLQTDAIFFTPVENPGGEFGSWILMAAICFFILYKKYKLSNWKLLIR
ncbi:MAG: CPBP family intramembrane glutamic endopeptidase [Bacteroidota bacterium]